MLSTNDLQKYCSTDHYRVELSAPFSRGEYTWATNGHILVRVPRFAEIGNNPKAPDVEKMWTEHFENLPMRPLVAGNLPSVETKSVKCTECDGRGKYHECPDCDCDCEECNGSGVMKYNSDTNTSLNIGEVVFSLRYVRLLSSLPEPQIPDTPRTEKPMPFCFSGGEGMLMPMRGGYSNHLTIKV